MNVNSSPVRAVLRLRALAPHGINGTQTGIIDRLQQLEADGRIDELDIGVWGRSIGINRAAERDPSGVRETVFEFEQWANEHGCTLRPAFERRNDHVAGEGRVVLPLICLAIYTEEAVQAVYPHVDGERVYTIHDGVKVLEAMTAGSEGSSVQTKEETAAPRP